MYIRYLSQFPGNKNDIKVSTLRLVVLQSEDHCFYVVAVPHMKDEIIAVLRN